ncbi:hypothetical protein M885DRAFT_569802 [Pelagophyceae sp. CCMP2097]|nr:hypothetical protein M885DRAFT_569802 [Pelagophyceae sp. CCMP2097]
MEEGAVAAWRFSVNSGDLAMAQTALGRGGVARQSDNGMSCTFCFETNKGQTTPDARAKVPTVDAGAQRTAA